jgi:tetratricopeptide (TPR) repeat protein
MKAEHRKELETNTLADHIGQFVQNLKQGPSRSALVWGTAIAVLILLIVAYRWIASNAASNDSGRWLRFDQITSREDLETFLKDNAETEQGRLARFELARLDLVEGLGNLGSLNRADAVKKVQRAADIYEKLSSESGNTPQLTREALLNAAKARESLGEYDKAKQLYQRLARDFPQSLAGKSAAEQAKALDSSSPELEELKQIAKDTSGDTIRPAPPAP